MASKYVYSVITLSHALCNPGYDANDERWLEGLWGIYKTEKAAENSVLTKIIEDCRNYKILYEDDIPRDEFGDTEYASCQDREVMRFEIISKDLGIPVIKSIISIAKCEIEEDKEEEKDTEEEEDKEWATTMSENEYYSSMFSDWVHGY